MSEQTDHSPPLGGPPDDVRAAGPELAEPPDALDELDRLGGRLRSLASRPLEDHPALLDEIHRAVVAELDALAAGGRAAGG